MRNSVRRFCVALLLSATLFGQARTPLTPGPHIFNVVDFGAKGDGQTLNTTAIASAIAAAARAGGGTVVFPTGIYVTGTFTLSSNITLELRPGSVIQGSKNLADYGSIEAFGLGHVYGTDSSGEGTKIGIVFARNVENVSIIGPGVIDGNGDAFFDPTKPHYSIDFDPSTTRQGQRSLDVLQMVGDGPIQQKPDGRPGTMIICFDCKSVLIRDVTLRNAPNWTAHLNRAERAVITGLHVINNPLIPNNDGFDCFGCKDVHFSDCDIRTGDDDFAIVNSRDITVANCTLESRSSGIRLEATEFATFENLSIHTNRGIAVYERGFGKTDHVSFANIQLETQLFTGHWWGKGEPIYIAAAKPQSGAGSGQISDLSFSNISGDAESSIVLYGHPDAWLRNITLDNVHFTIRATRQEVIQLVGGNFDLRWTATELKQAVIKHDIPGIYGRYVDGLSIHNSSIRWCLDERCGPKLLTAKGTKESGKDREEDPSDRADFFSSAIEVEDFKNLDLNGFRGVQAPGSVAPALALTRGENIVISNSTADAGTKVFLEAHDISGKTLLMGNDLANATTVLRGDAIRFVLRANYLPQQKATVGNLK